MKRIAIVSGSLIAAGLTTAVILLQHAELAKLRAENLALQEQVTQVPQLEAQLGAAAEQRRSLLTPGGGGGATTSPSEDTSPELLRLRGRVAAVREQQAEIEQLRAENRELRAAAGSEDWHAKLHPEQLLKVVGWGSNSCKEVASRYSEAWLKQVAEPGLLLKTGMALYDAGKYSDALTVFQKLEQSGRYKGAALVWQGQMLDLLGRRQEALVAYNQVAGLHLGMVHDQYGMSLSRDLIQSRLEIPFTRVENRQDD